LDRRTHHYMPSSLLPTQLRTLEEPGADEQAVVVVAHTGIAETVQAALDEL